MQISNTNESFGLLSMHLFPLCWELNCSLPPLPFCSKYFKKDIISSTIDLYWSLAWINPFQNAGFIDEFLRLLIVIPAYEFDDLVSIPIVQELIWRKTFD